MLVFKKTIASISMLFFLKKISKNTHFTFKNGIGILYAKVLLPNFRHSSLRDKLREPSHSISI
jgi:hypothetical protein